MENSTGKVNADDGPVYVLTRSGEKFLVRNPKNDSDYIRKVYRHYGVESEFKKDEMEREIIGYKFKDEDCYDKFVTVFNELSENVYVDGYNKEGVYWKSGFDFPNEDWQPYLKFAKRHNFLEELFNPVYKEEFKVGDIVVGWHNCSNELSRKPWEIGKIVHFVHPKNKRSYWFTDINSIRKATPEEIEEFNKKENDLKAGHWYKTGKEKSLWFIKSIDSEGKGSGYGYLFGQWTKAEKIQLNKENFDFKESSIEEVEDILIEEAKSRGLKKGALVNPIQNSETIKLTGSMFLSQKMNALFGWDSVGGYSPVLEDGVWVEPKKENEFKTEVEKAIISVDNLRKALEKLEAVTSKLKQNK